MHRGYDIVINSAPRPKAQPLPSYRALLAKACTLLERHASSIFFFFYKILILEISI